MIPWKYLDQDFNPGYDHILINHWFGYIYIITNLKNDKQYVGKKSFHTFARNQKRQSDWHNYYSSSEELKQDIVRHGAAFFKFDIHSIHKGKEELSYYEIREMFLQDVLYAKLPNGERRFYNLHIPCASFHSDK